MAAKTPLPSLASTGHIIAVPTVPLPQTNKQTRFKPGSKRPPVVASRTGGQTAIRLKKTRVE